MLNCISLGKLNLTCAYQRLKIFTSLALRFHDFQRMTWVHWLLYNIPVTADGLPKAVSPKDLPLATLEGKNDWQRTGYGGPCPPVGRHRYYHKLYALDITLPDLQLPSKVQLEKAMAGHILETAELIGTFHRK